MTRAHRVELLLVAVVAGMLVAGLGFWVAEAFDGWSGGGWGGADYR